MNRNISVRISLKALLALLDIAVAILVTLHPVVSGELQTGLPSVSIRMDRINAKIYSTCKYISKANRQFFAFWKYNVKCFNFQTLLVETFLKGGTEAKKKCSAFLNIIKYLLERGAYHFSIYL